MSKLFVMYKETASRNIRKLKMYMAVNASIVVSGCLNWKVLMKTSTSIMYLWGDNAIVRLSVGNLGFLHHCGVEL